MILILLSLFASFASSATNCQQCTGTVTLSLTFGFDVLTNQVNFIKQAVGTCSAAGQTTILPDGELSCRSRNHCKSFKYNIVSERFCGNGPVARFNKFLQCSSANYKGPCVVQFDLTCSNKIDCTDLNCLTCRAWHKPYATMYRLLMILQGRTVFKYWVSPSYFQRIRTQIVASPDLY